MSAPTALDEPQTEHAPPGSGDEAHIVDQRKWSIVDAHVFGTEIEALCGYRWVPTKTPAGKPVCKACLDIFENMDPSGDHSFDT